MSGLRSFQQAELEVIKLVERRTARDYGHLSTSIDEGQVRGLHHVHRRGTGYRDDSRALLTSFSFLLKFPTIADGSVPVGAVRSFALY